MFDNIGKKIMKLATVICWIGIIFSIIGFIVMLALGIDNEDDLLIGLSFVVLVVGIFGSWIGSFFIYGFGKLIDNSDILVKNNETKKEPLKNEVKKSQPAKIGLKVIAIDAILKVDDENVRNKYTIPEGITSGVYVTTVVEDSIAKGKLKENDIILEFNGVKVNSGSDLFSEVKKVQVGFNRTSNVKIVRDGEEKNIQLIF